MQTKLRNGIQSINITGWTGVPLICNKCQQERQMKLEGHDPSNNLFFILIEYFKEICSEIGKRYWFKFDAIGTDGDHVHVFVGAAPRYAPSNIMQIIKSIT